MIIQCPHCRTRFRFDERHLMGKHLVRVRCARCQQVFSVESQDDAPLPLSLEEVQEVRESRVLAFSNQKGGVAKTTSCLYLGMALARRNYRVLLVDFDTQANLSTLLGVREESPSFYELMESGTALEEGIQRVQEGLALLPSNPRMHLLPKRYLGTQGYEQLLHRALEPIKGAYDYILIDTPPSLKFFALNGLAAADRVIIPTQCAFLSVQGVAQMEQVIDSLRKRLGRPKDYRLLVTLQDPRSTASQVVYRTLMERWGARVLPQAIPVDGAVGEAQILKQSLFTYAPTSEAARAYLAIARQLESEH